METLPNPFLTSDFENKIKILELLQGFFVLFCFVFSVLSETSQNSSTNDLKPREAIFNSGQLDFFGSQEASPGMGLGPCQLGTWA